MVFDVKLNVKVFAKNLAKMTKALAVETIPVPEPKPVAPEPVKAVPSEPIWSNREKPKLVDETMSGALTLSREAMPKTVDKKSQKYLESLEYCPDDLSTKEWESRIVTLRFEKRFSALMKDVFQIDILRFNEKDKKQIKMFYGMAESLSNTLELMEYVVNNWMAIRRRYNLPYEYPNPQLFCFKVFVQDVKLEFQKKKSL